jgi:hypothetical protein
MFAMKRALLGALAAAVTAFALTLPAAGQSDQQPPREERMRHWAADRETMLHAKLAGMKAGLAVKPEQEDLWTAFESAITSVFKSHNESVQTAKEPDESVERASPLDRMDSMAGRMAQGAGELKTISDAAKPLYSSLDDRQKHNFELLGSDMSEPEPEPTTNKSVEGYDKNGSSGFGWYPYHWFGPQ